MLEVAMQQNSNWKEFPLLMVYLGVFTGGFVNISPHTLMSWQVTTIATYWVAGWGMLAAIGHYIDCRPKRQKRPPVDTVRTRTSRLPSAWLR